MSEEKVNWLNVLHFYQPPFQDSEVLKRITGECYLPVSCLLLERPHAGAVVNINGCLLEMLEKFPEGEKVIRNLKTLFLSGRIEISGTAKYHPLIPLIDIKEAKTQLLGQEMSLKSFFGVCRRPEILFLPELAYRPELLIVFEYLGYRCIIIDEMSVKNNKQSIGRSLLKEKGRDMQLLVRDRAVSESLCNSPWRKYDVQTPGHFLELSRHRVYSGGFIVTVSDAEVFGHHQKERWKLLEEIYDNGSVRSIMFKDLAAKYESEEVETVPASWSTTTEDISARTYYPLWHNPDNPLHTLLWQLLDLTLEEVRSGGSEPQNRTMDRLLSSCPFFWASCAPWWNGIIVENAADNMFELLLEIEGCPQKYIARAEVLRKNIYDEVSRLNKTGKAEELQNKFLADKGLNRKDLHHLIH